MIAETYVNQIVRKVRCPKQRRAEIKRQLLADINMALEQGETLDQVMFHMGEPIAIAEEFNQNLSVKEQKSYKRGIWIKIIAVVAAVIAVLILAAVWFLPKTQEFGKSGIFSKEMVEEKSQEVIRLLDAEDYEAIKACSDKQMQPILTKQVIDEAKAQAAPEWGAFLEFGKCYMTEIRQQGKIMAMVQMNAAYEKVGITYTLFFNEDMELAGLYIK